MAIGEGFGQLVDESFKGNYSELLAIPPSENLLELTKFLKATIADSVKL